MTKTTNTQLLKEVQLITLEKTQQVLLNDFSRISSVGPQARYALTLQANLEAYGYSFSTDVLKALSHQSVDELTKFNSWFMPALQTSLGAHRNFSPMYPNFPKQVFEASRTELVINAIMHYMGDAIGLRIMPQYTKEARLPLDTMPKIVPEGFLDNGAEPLKLIGGATMDDVRALFTNTVSSNTSLSESDKEATRVLFSYFKELGEVEGLVSAAVIPQKENLSYVTKMVIEQGLAVDTVVSKFNNITDVLRVAVALSDGDVSLAAPTKFAKFKRPMRRAILGLMEGVMASSQGDLVVENMFQKRDVWVRLGEKLHPGEYSDRFPLAAQMFVAVRNDKKPLNFNAKVDVSVDAKKFEEAIELLKTRPGVFARSLNRLFQRIEDNPVVKLERPVKVVAQPVPVAVEPNNPFAVLKGKFSTMAPVVEEKVVALPQELSRVEKERLIGKTVQAFGEVASAVSTPVLLQVYNHFKTQGEKEQRIFLPKGAVAKAFVAENNVKALSSMIADDITFICRSALVERFKELPALGKTYVGEELKEQNVPFAMRSASKALKTVARGSKMDIEETKDTTRFFIWWQEPKSGQEKDYWYSERVDIDLSVVFLNEEFKYVDHCSFTKLKGQGFAHSGDITSAPDGACEFIDINRSEMNPAVAYAVMVVNSYTNQPYYELPECFAGWMQRDKPQTGEVYEPRTVANKFDLTSDSQTVMPMIIDVKNNKAIWADLSLKQGSYWNMIEGQTKSLEYMVKSMVFLTKPNLYDLFTMHAEARGEIVADKAQAETVFSLHEGITPYQYQTIAAEFMADKVEAQKPKKKM